MLQIPGVFFEIVPMDQALVLGPPAVPARQQSCEAAPTFHRFHQEPKTEWGGPGQIEIDFRSHDGSQARAPGRCMETRDPVDAPSVGQCQRRVAEASRTNRQVFGVGSTLQKGKSTASAQFDVFGGQGGGGGHVSIFALFSPPVTPSRCFSQALWLSSFAVHAEQSGPAHWRSASGPAR